MMNLKLTKEEARMLLMHLAALTDAGAETLSEHELEVLDQITLKLNKGVFK